MNKSRVKEIFLLVKQAIKYGFVGVTNVVIDFIIYIALTRSFDFWRKNFIFANTISFLCAVSWSFYWNRRWTFKDQTKHDLWTKFFKFVGVVSVGIAIAESSVYVMVTHWRIYDLWAKLITAFLVFLWNFPMSRLVFKKQKAVEKIPISN
ncbi:MAG: GtrA family protein [Candidatus Magasanikbacteria bacterium]|nr:GtrA family protein [Candidatus Magasanikbacteria bacterium]